ncbi:hypothetical protein [Reyranella massiliensis]|uniref:hypothetical protein n=1 Tax=Reyranella massiliensis TaxID=445220 RepID=UPI00030D5045|nr:hypothetical protein [Reyranella massiliensis]
MFLRSMLVHAALFAGTSTLLIAVAQADDLKTRCDQLIAYFDRYGSGRGEHSDGARNMTRLSARIDCDRGQYEEGIKAMEDLLRRKKLAVPSAQT